PGTSAATGGGMQSDFTAVPNWLSWENAGASVAVADIDRDGRPDVVLLMVDAPAGASAGYYRVGRELDDAGGMAGGWTGWQPVPDWFPAGTAAGGVAGAAVRGPGRLDLVVFPEDAA